MAVFALGDSIKLRCMRWSGVVSNAMLREEGTESNILAAIIRVESPYPLFQFVLNQRCKGYEGLFDLGFLFEWLEPGVASIVIDDNEIVLVVIYR